MNERQCTRLDFPHCGWAKENAECDRGAKKERKKERKRSQTNDNRDGSDCDRIGFRICVKRSGIRRQKRRELEAREGQEITFC